MSSTHHPTSRPPQVPTRSSSTSSTTSRTTRSHSDEAYDTARYCLIDTLGCGFEALEYPACTKLLGPDRAGHRRAQRRARCRARRFQLDPVQAAFNIGAMIRWLDFNDTWLAAEWGHPSDNLGGILAIADWLSRNAVARGKQPLTMRDVLTAMIKAHEIQGVHRAGEQLQPRRPRPRGAGEGRVDRRRRADARALRATRSSTRCRSPGSTARSLRTYRHAPNTGSRKSWAAGDATVARRAPRADGADRRDGLSVGADAPRPGASTTCCSRASRSSSSGPTAAT